MPLIEDLSRYGIEDCPYSSEAQKSNAYSTRLRGSVLVKPESNEMQIIRAIMVGDRNIRFLMSMSKGSKNVTGKA
ncbi:hypothetical protein TNCV_1703241 [Trichonephila clavipes]|nr:hypothetical protein TNCV_1703241 [Trichonephila clavipes]